MLWVDNIRIWIPAEQVVAPTAVPSPSPSPSPSPTSTLTATATSANSSLEVFAPIILEQNIGPDNSILFIRSNNIYMLDCSSAPCSETQLTQFGDIGEAIWSPDRSQIMFLYFGTSPGLYLMSTPGSPVASINSATQVINENRIRSGMVWSPNGTHIAVVTGQEIAVINLNYCTNSAPLCGPEGITYGSNPNVAELFTGSYGQPFLNPSWSPDSTKLVYSYLVPYSSPLTYELRTIQLLFDVFNPDKVIGNENPVVVVGNLEHSNQYPTTLSNHPKPVWSPAGTKIAYQWFSDLWLYNFGPPSSNQMIDTASLTVNYPAWSPDGSQIAFSTGLSGGNVYVMDSSFTSPPTSLTSNSSGYWELDWGLGTPVVTLPSSTAPTYDTPLPDPNTWTSGEDCTQDGSPTSLLGCSENTYEAFYNLFIQQEGRIPTYQDLLAVVYDEELGDVWGERTLAAFANNYLGSCGNGCDLEGLLTWLASKQGWYVYGGHLDENKVFIPNPDPYKIVNQLIEINHILPGGEATAYDFARRVFEDSWNGGYGPNIPFDWGNWKYEDESNTPYQRIKGGQQPVILCVVIQGWSDLDKNTLPDIWYDYIFATVTYYQDTQLPQTTVYNYKVDDRPPWLDDGQKRQQRFPSLYSQPTTCNTSFAETTADYP
jgi:hypothetical protein